MAAVKSLKTDVLICGAGPTGLVLAIELARRGVDFLIIDKNQTTSVHSKALGLQARSLEMLASMKVIDQFLARGKRLSTFEIYSETQKLAETDFSHLPTRYPYALILGQAESEKILLGHLQKTGQRVLWQHELICLQQHTNSVKVELQNGVSIECQYLVGCDGSHSQVRNLLNIQFSGNSYEEEFLLADAKVDSGLSSENWQLHLSEDNLLLLIPMPGGFHRLVVNVTPKGKSQRQAGLEAILKELSQIADKIVPGLKFSNPQWLSRFRLHRRMVDAYHKGCVFLAGDAAHIHSPAGGQGMNTGMQDAFNLGFKLAAVLKNRAHKKLLHTYEEERLPVARNVLAGTDVISKTVLNGNPLWRFMRDGAISLLSNVDFLQDSIAERISQLDISYSTTVSRILTPGPISPGQRAPDIPTGLGLRTYDYLTSENLVLFTSKKIDDLPDYVDQVMITRAPSEMKTSGVQAMLVRPDLYIHEVFFRGLSKEKILNSLKDLYHL